jgi:hypothetical protein
MAAVQMPGQATVTVALEHVHGDRMFLCNHPELVHLYIQKTPRGGKRRHRPETWRPYGGHRFPDPSPTVFRDLAYATMQHALLACLLWFSGEASGLLRHSPLRAGFPTLMLDGVPTPNDDGGGLAVHLVTEEPSHSELLAIRHSMQNTGLRRCMLLVGVLRPSSGGGRHQLHGILCSWWEGMPPVGLPDGAVQHGWYPCLTRDTGSLIFVRHGADEVGPLVPAVLPSLASLGLRLWRRGTAAAYAIVGRSEPISGEDWDRRLRAAGV